jgi:predicted phosphodiesterase
MKYAIISDIHGNLEAFSVFLSLIPKLKINKIVCLGDVVGYNANPNEIINALYKIENLLIIRGNHDRAVSTGDYIDFSYNAAEAIRWTIKHLLTKNKTFLDALDRGPKIVDDIFGICHGSTYDEDFYIFTKQDTKIDFAWMQDADIHLLFYGHTHQQKAFVFDKENKQLSLNKENIIKIQKNNYYLINPGSIGQPRDGNPKGSFAVFDSEKMTVKIYRFDYDIKTTQQKIIDNNLPFILASRLSVGK